MRRSGPSDRFAVIHRAEMKAWMDAVAIQASNRVAQSLFSVDRGERWKRIIDRSRPSFFFKCVEDLLLARGRNAELLD
jgi:hypothetical protein